MWLFRKFYMKNGETWHIIYLWKGNLISNTMVKILSVYHIQNKSYSNFKKAYFLQKNIWCTDYFADVSKNWHVTGQYFLPNCLLYNGLLLCQILFHLHKWLRNKRGGGGGGPPPPASTTDQSSPPLIGLRHRSYDQRVPSSSPAWTSVLSWPLNVNFYRFICV